MSRHPNLLKRSRAALLIVDVQERFAPVINDMDAIVGNIVKLVRGCKILDIPVFYTEQYPKHGYEGDKGDEMVVTSGPGVA